MVMLPEAETKTLTTCPAVLTEYQRVRGKRRGGQTDGQTSCDDIVRAMHKRRVIKTGIRI